MKNHDLPKGLSIRQNKSGEVFEIRMRKNGRQFRKVLPPNTTLETATSILQTIKAQKHKEKLEHMMVTLPLNATKNFENDYPELDIELRKILSRTKARAKKKDIPCTITIHQLFRAYYHSAGRCQVTGTPFQFFKSDKYARANPFQPSIDRVDSSQGYTKENIRFVCYGVNVALSEWGEEIFTIFAKNLITKKIMNI